MVVSCYPQKPGCNAYGILWRSRALGHHDDAFPTRASFRKWEMPAVGIAVVELPAGQKLLGICYITIENGHL